MTNRKFYTFFIVLNILIIAFFAESIWLVYVLFAEVQGPHYIIAAFFGFASYITYITLKLLLPKIFVNLANKYENSLISQFTEFIRNNPNQKKFILPLAFCFDLPFMLRYFDNFHNLSDFFWFLFAYFALYGGGVGMFYVSLFGVLKIQGKLKKL